MSPILYVLSGFLIAGAIAGIILGAIQAIHAFTRFAVALEALGEFNASVAKLSGAAEGLAAVPKFIEGHGKAALAIATQVEKLNVVVKRFADLLISPKAGKEALTYPDESKASDWADVQKYLRDGMQREEAESQVLTENYLRQTLGVE